MVRIIGLVIAATAGSRSAKSTQSGIEVDALIPGATQEAEFIFRIDDGKEVRLEQHRGTYVARGGNRDCYVVHVPCFGDLAVKLHVPFGTKNCNVDEKLALENQPLQSKTTLRFPTYHYLGDCNAFHKDVSVLVVEKCPQTVEHMLESMPKDIAYSNHLFCYLSKLMEQNVRLFTDGLDSCIFLGDLQPTNIAVYPDYRQWQWGQEIKIYAVDSEMFMVYTAVIESYTTSTAMRVCMRGGLPV